VQAVGLALLKDQVVTSYYAPLYLGVDLKKALPAD